MENLFFFGRGIQSINLSRYSIGLTDNKQPTPLGPMKALIFENPIALNVLVNSDTLYSFMCRPAATLSKDLEMSCGPLSLFGVRQMY